MVDNPRDDSADSEAIQFVQGFRDGERQRFIDGVTDRAKGQEGDGVLGSGFGNSGRFHLQHGTAKLSCRKAGVRLPPRGYGGT